MLNTISTYQLLCLAFFLAIMIHNLEEYFWLPKWSKTAGKWSSPLDTQGFRKTLWVISISLFVMTLLAITGSLIGAYLMAGYAVAMVLNVFKPHLLATIDMKAYSPGLASALLLNLPIGGYLVYYSITEMQLSTLIVVISSAIIAISLLLGVPRLTQRFSAG